MNQEKEIRSIGKLIILHLLPGIVLSAIYVILLKSGVLEGYPKIVILSLAGVLSMIPGKLVYLFYVAKKEEGSFNIFKVLGLKSKMTVKGYIFYTILLFIVSGGLATAFKPLSNYLLNTAFSWIPSWYNYNQDISLFSTYFIVITVIAYFFFMTLMGPIIEEIYFRGYLLARMKWMGKYGVLLNVVLFSIYHFWSPWEIVFRTVVMLPVFYCVYKKDSLKLAIFIHCLLNFMDVVALLMLL